MRGAAGAVLGTHESRRLVCPKSAAACRSDHRSRRGFRWLAIADWLPGCAVHHDQALTTEIQRWGMRRGTADVVASLQQAGVLAAPVRSPQEAVQDERLMAREETLPVQHPTLGSIDGLRRTGISFRLAASRIGFERLAPRVGEHTGELLREAAAQSDAGNFRGRSCVSMFRHGTVNGRPPQVCSYGASSDRLVVKHGALACGLAHDGAYAPQKGVISDV
jgi:hypothetical protein